MRRHPADYQVPAAAARGLYYRWDARSIAFLNAAQARHPTHPGLHVLAARLLRRTGHVEQAAVEYSLALRHSRKPEQLLPEVLEVYPDAVSAARAIPFATGRRDRIIGALKKADRSDVALAYVELELELKPDGPEALLLHAMLAREANNLTKAEASARRAHEVSPSTQTAEELARTLITIGNLEEAEATADNLVRLRGGTAAAEVLLLLSEALAARGKLVRAERVLSRAARVPASDQVRAVILRRRQELRAREPGTTGTR